VTRLWEFSGNSGHFVRHPFGNRSVSTGEKHPGKAPFFELLTTFGTYWLHRLQHSVPFLWSMHSLHHSAEAMTMATGARHYWVEQAIVAAFLPGVAMVFKIPMEILRFMPLFFIAEYLAHMNMKVRFGALTLVFNNPQFHRIHHSIEPQHRDKNFCKNLPIFDVIFGTAWVPGRDEFPRTGLTPREKPVGLLEGVVWPLRHFPVVRRLLGSIPQI
jgi:sterol desaturase/sphingolipid hydroxylase (fatty acid hydroxylase superfamily)